MSATKTYLTAYNITNAALWAVVLYRTISTLISSGFQFDSVYPAVGDLTRWAQTIIALDCAHVLSGLVRTSLLTTLLQSFARLFIVHAITPNSTSAHNSPFYSLMLISWSIAEIVRYSFYVSSATSHNGQAPGWLVWARYNLFFVLYITGAGSEWMCMWNSLPELKAWTAKQESAGFLGVAWYIVLVMLVLWPIFFPNQYLHMMALRRKMMRGKKKA